MDIEGISFDKVKNIFGKKVDFFEKLLRKFCHKYENYDDQIKECKDIDDIGEYIHSLKGLSGNLGATRVFDLSCSIEKKCREIVDCDLEEDLKLMGKEIEVVINGYAKYLERKNS